MWQDIVENESRQRQQSELNQFLFLLLCFLISFNPIRFMHGVILDLLRRYFELISQFEQYSLNDIIFE